MSQWYRGNEIAEQRRKASPRIEFWVGMRQRHAKLLGERKEENPREEYPTNK